jgi:hypothetical protein
MVVLFSRFLSKTADEAEDVWKQVALLAPLHWHEIMKSLAKDNLRFSRR